MRSMNWSAPRAHDPATLEAKVDDLHRKLDGLLSQTPAGGCPMCGVCSKHDKQQEATANQLSAQARLLDSLERKVMEVRTSLEKLACGLEERNLDNVSVPVVALQRRKSLPVRTTVDEVYVRLDMPRDQKTIQNAFNVPCGKGRRDILIEDKEDERLRGEGPSVQHEPLSHKVKMELTAAAPQLATSQTSPAGDNMTKKKDGIESTILQHSQATGAPITTSKLVPPPPRNVPKIKVTKTSQNQTLSKMAQTTAAVKTLLSSSSVTTAKTSVAGSIMLTSNQKTADMATPVTTTATVTSMSSNPTKLTVAGTIAPSPLVQNPQKINLGVSSATSQSMAPMSIIASPQNHLTLSEKEITAPSPNSPQVASMGAPLPTSQKSSTNSQSLFTTKTPHTTGIKSPLSSVTSLKHVQSCPDSLQRLHEAGGKNVTSVALPVTGAAAGVTGTGQLSAGGVQLRISPAPAIHTTQTKTPANTCLKIIDDVPPQPAPFPYRFVSLRPSPSCDFSINTREVLGGGRFGKVHKCTDIKTNLRMAAKIISARSAKEREMALNEIQVMNQLSHPNILQLYDAYEAKNQVVLILEYVEGGELFERIVDERSPLTELDAMLFVKQICEGIQYMHQMYVLHLDLKPENILCVNRSGYQIKIIDFGLARRYKPREKLKVSFGTPEFLAPEVVNFDFVSFPTDMWTLGVVTYMLLSGLSPFLGDDDSQTLNNVITVNWYFDEDAFEHVSAEAKDFVSNLLIRERSGRFSATQCLKHPWLNNISEKAKHSNVILKSQVLLRKYMARRLWKKNYIAIAAANRFKKISSSGSLTSLGV